MRTLSLVSGAIIGAAAVVITNSAQNRSAKNRTKSLITADTKDIQQGQKSETIEQEMADFYGAHTPTP